MASEVGKVRGEKRGNSKWPGPSRKCEAKVRWGRNQLGGGGRDRATVKKKNGKKENEKSKIGRRHRKKDDLSPKSKVDGGNFNTSRKRVLKRQAF